MNTELEVRYQIDILAEQAGGYFSAPNEEDLAYTDLLFSVCRQFGIRYYTATAKEKYFVDEVTRVTWACQKSQSTAKPFRPAFTKVPA